MKRIAVALACVGFLAGGADCDKGTLGTPSGGGNTGTTGVGTLDGVGGRAPIGSGSGAAAGVGEFGIGGNGTPTGGVGGFGGRSATGGTGFVSCPPLVPPLCGPAACGNGTVDRCLSSTSPQCGVSSVAEECDGDQFAGDSCAQRGFGSGKLACTATCTVDASACSDCLPIGGPLLSCGPAPITFPSLGTFGLGANDSEVGLAQIDYNNSTGYSRLTFARLDAKLALINAVGLEDTSQPGPLQGTYIDTVAVTAQPSGWLVAACGGHSLFVHVLDANAKKVARTVISDSGDVPLACLSGTMALVARPGGGALLTWQTYYNAAFAVIAADGTSTGPTQLSDDRQMVTIGYPTAAWVTDAFYVGLPLEIITPTTSYVVVRLLRLGTDGKLGKVADVLKDEFSASPSFVLGAGDIRLVYGGIPPGSSDLGMLWRRFGSGGEVASNPVVLGPANYFSRTPAVAFGDDSVALLNGGAQEQLTIAHVDLGGKVVTPSFDIALSPDYSLYMYDMVRRGPEVVVGWMRYGANLMLARVTP